MNFLPIFPILYPSIELTKDTCGLLIGILREFSGSALVVALILGYLTPRLVFPSPYVISFHLFSYHLIYTPLLQPFTLYFVLLFLYFLRDCSFPSVSVSLVYTIISLMFFFTTVTLILVQ